MHCMVCADHRRHGSSGCLGFSQKSWALRGAKLRVVFCSSAAAHQIIMLETHMDDMDGICSDDAVVQNFFHDLEARVW